MVFIICKTERRPFLYTFSKNQNLARKKFVVKFEL